MKTSASSEKTIIILCDGNFPTKGPALKALKDSRKQKCEGCRSAEEKRTHNSIY